jgi:hypothetical protein
VTISIKLIGAARSADAVRSIHAASGPVPYFEYFEFLGASFKVVFLERYHTNACSADCYRSPSEQPKLSKTDSTRGPSSRLTCSEQSASASLRSKALESIPRAACFLRTGLCFELDRHLQDSPYLIGSTH